MGLVPLQLAGLAATALYLASTMTREEGSQVTQREIAEAAAVTEVTIRNRYKGLKMALKIQEPTDA